jgi:GNAT superfamily N-acetyltransferase
MEARHQDGRRMHGEIIWAMRRAVKEVRTPSHASFRERNMRLGISVHDAEFYECSLIPSCAYRRLEVFDVVTTDLRDPATAPLLDGLLHEYSTRYGQGAVREFDGNPPEHFTEECGGALLLLREGGTTVAGGALRRYDPAFVAAGVVGPEFPVQGTAEFKRIWTHDAYRRRGLGRRVLRELELRATSLGYQRVFLTTGPRQPEAVGLYLAAGYTELPDLGAQDRGFALHPFLKVLPDTDAKA